jgi:YMGG-like Gly-zipper
MRRAIGLAVLAVVACKPALTPTEQAAKDRSECMVVALDQSGFDPVTAEEPPRTVSSTHERGGNLEEGAGTVVKGAAGGAVAGVVGGAIMGDAGKGAAAGAAIGGLIGGAKHYQKSHEMVTTTRPNPEYQQYVANKTAYKNALEQCLAARAGAPK